MYSLLSLSDNQLEVLFGFGSSALEAAETRIVKTLTRGKINMSRVS